MYLPLISSDHVAVERNVITEPSSVEGWGCRLTRWLRYPTSTASSLLQNRHFIQNFQTVTIMNQLQKQPMEMF